MKRLRYRITGFLMRIRICIAGLSVAMLQGCGAETPPTPPPEPAETSASVSVRMATLLPADNVTTDSFWGMVNDAEADQ